jgi:hypothetical protein
MKYNSSKVMEMLLRPLILILFMAIACICNVSLGVANDASFDEVFCKKMKQFKQNGLQDIGAMLDSITINDGMAVFCGNKIIEFKKIIIVSGAEIREGWEERKNAQWDEIMCSNDLIRKAVDGNWIIANLMTFSDGRRFWHATNCRPSR